MFRSKLFQYYSIAFLQAENVRLAGKALDKALYNIFKMLGGFEGSLRIFRGFYDLGDFWGFLGIRTKQFQGAMRP
jgi:hypothetical protein